MALENAVFSVPGSTDNGAVVLERDAVYRSVIRARVLTTNDTPYQCSLIRCF